MGSQIQNHVQYLQVATLLLLTFALALSFCTGRKIHRRSGRSREAVELGCSGIYDTQFFFELNKLCEDCLGLTKESEVYNLCRYTIFTYHTVLQKKPVKIDINTYKCLKTIKNDLHVFQERLLWHRWFHSLYEFAAPTSRQEGKSSGLYSYHWKKEVTKPRASFSINRNL